MKISSSWIRHGFLNTLEHGITRVSDALVSLILLWALSPEVFSKLALAQAAVAPMLLLFVSPETIMYRDFGKWKAQGPSAIAGRIRAYRRFGWGKAQAALLISIVGALLIPSQTDQLTRFAAFLWAFSLALAPQISGADREFLRLGLHLRELNILSLFQKLVILIGSAAALALFPAAPIGWLAGVAVVSAVVTALLARAAANRVLRAQGVDASVLTGRGAPPVVPVLLESFQNFSVWQHLSGVVLNWVQTMDLFFLGLFRLPARQIGLYASVLKLANLSIALPTALSNTFVVWVGRRVPEDDPGKERDALKRLSLLLGGGSFLQALVLGIFAPYLIRLLSHGRWSDVEQTEMVVWFRWMLTGGVLFCSVLLLNFWLALRTDIAQLFKRLYLPWVLASALIYSMAVWTGGAARAAQANVAVSLIYVVLLLLYRVRNEKSKKA